MPRFSPLAKKSLRLFALVAATLLITSCGITADNAPLDTLGDDLAGPEAQAIGAFMRWVLWIAYAVFIAVLGVTFYAWKNFRIKGDEYEEGDWPEQIHGNTTLELLWTAAPLVLLIVIGFFTLGLHQDLNSDQEDAFNVLVEGANVTWDPQIVVVGQQWWWEYQYHFGDVDIDQERVETLPTPDITTATQMVVPVGVEIELEITSRDVIHSHWIPSLNGKRDAVPGRQSAPWKIQADEPGVYFGQCTEFCGLSHSRMRMQVVALEEAEFNEWVSLQMQGVSLDDATAAFVDELVSGEVPTPVTGAERGVATFRSKCASCHLMEGIADDLWSEEGVAEVLVSCLLYTSPSPRDRG